MNLTLLKQGLNTAFVGRTIVWLDSTESTNRVAADLAQRGAPEGTIVLADYQSAGRGRLGRAWIADPGDSLLCSLILRPSIPAAEVSILTMIPALAALATIEGQGIAGAGLKWPNDVQIAGLKVAGILTEMSLRGQALDYVVAGIGLNVNLDVGAHPLIAAQATSLRQALGVLLNREDVASSLFHNLEEQYLLLQQGRAEAIFAAWRARLTMLGHWIEVSEGRASYLAFAEDVTPDGGLVLRRDGARSVVYAGDVTLSKPS